MNLQISQNLGQSAQKLKRFLGESLSASDFEALPHNLGITRKLWGRCLNRPEMAPEKVIIDLARLLQVPTQFLIEQFNMGFDRLTVTELLNTAAQ